MKICFKKYIYILQGVNQQDRDQKEALDEQTRAASENLFKKKKEV